MSTQTSRIIAALADGKWHSVAAIHRRAGTSRLNSRVSDLRGRGFVIECEHVAGRGSGAYAYRYRLVHSPVPLDPPVLEAETLDWDDVAPRNEAERYRLYALRGDDLQLIATCATPEAVGVAVCTLGEEGEWRDSCIGVLDTLGDPDRAGVWLVKPWDGR